MAKSVPKQLKQSRRGYGRKNARNKLDNRKHDLTLIGTNANGLSTKRESLFRIINIFKPSIVTVQETMFSY